MPFLGPAIVAWIVLGTGVMAYYFLFIVRTHEPAGRREEVEWRESRTDATPSWAKPAPWVEPARTVLPRSEGPTYEMEDFPTESWGPTAG